MEYSILDIETDGLLETVTKIHCMSVHHVKDGMSSFFTLTDYNSIKKYVENAEVIIGHNIILFDIPVLVKILNAEIKAKLIDTLGLSWCLYPTLTKHGLEEWGVKLGVVKPIVEDWTALDEGVYIHRCQQDVQINSLLWDKQWDYLMRIYQSENAALRYISYLSFKLDCIREQGATKWKLDIEKCKKNLEVLLKEEKIKVDALSDVMPAHIKYKVVSRPNRLMRKAKKKGEEDELSEAGKKWFELLKNKGLPENRVSAVEVEESRTKGNPGSYQQLKAWLFSVGWEPTTFKYVKSTPKAETIEEYNPMSETSVRKIPQLTTDDGLCQSVKDLIPHNPGLEHLDNLYIVQHRIGILKGYLDTVDADGYVVSEISGFTNTLRVQHRKPICNLPTVHKPYGKLVRECLIAPKGFVLCGSDMSSLEDSTKQHYMYKYDPDYVSEMRTFGFDPHLDIAVQGGMLTPEQVQAHKDKKEDHSKVRKDAKVVNFSAVYGVGAPKMSLGTKWPLEKSQALLKIYWKRNWSVKKVAANTPVKTVDGQMWLYNPVSGFYYSLRFEKDKFSTLNQGTGVYCFDTWVRKVRNKGIRISMQYHDEIAFILPDGEQETVKQFLELAIAEANADLKLNVVLGISIDFGLNYAAIH